MHTEVPVKVNAWVDKGVAPLVEALNGFDHVWSAASCEDDPSGQIAPYPTYVMFSYQGDGRDRALFAVDLTEYLGDSIPFCLQMDWRAGNGEPLLTISCPPDQVLELAAALRKVSAPSDGTARTGLRS